MSKPYDAVIAGAGHNGMAAAGFLGGARKIAVRSPQWGARLSSTTLAEV